MLILDGGSLWFSIFGSPEWSVRGGSGGLAACHVSEGCASAFGVVRDVHGLSVLPAVTQHTCLELTFSWKSAGVCKQ